MGITEKGLEVVGETVSIFKTSPLTLSLMVMNFALLGFVYWQSLQFNTQRSENVKLFVDQTSKFNDMLAKCIVPEKGASNETMPRSSPMTFKPSPPIPFLPPR
jgi:hypothetical protein